MIKRVAGFAFSTLNRGEMQQFDGISDWWSPSGPMHILYKYNYERVQFLKENLPQLHPDALKPLTGISVLDVGCGAGFMAKSLARLGAAVVGLDPNATSFREAVEHKAKFGDELAGLKYVNCTLEEYLKGEGEKQFDVVASMDVIEHVDHPQRFLH
jgi:2-polyprenyl-6-hydroxyphenyl methylase/3-demethylubiquinone-9 3-methyltransferase